MKRDDTPRSATRAGIRRSGRPTGATSRSIYRPPWRIDVVRRSGTPRLLGDATVARVAAQALDAVAARALDAVAPRASVTIVLTDDAELADLNSEHMGLAEPTDVLSFPLLPPESFGRRPTRPLPAGEPLAPPPMPGLPPNRRTHLGDMAISVERAVEQAEAGRGGQTGDVRWSPADELRLLVIHGVLHLCGWDHVAPAEEAAMRALERRLLAEDRR